MKVICGLAHEPRKYMDPAALEEMTASVGKMGIIEPVVCRQDGATGLCYVVAGERRCAAARKAGLPTVPKNVLIEIAAKEQETGAPATRKRTKAEALAEGIGTTASKIGDIEFPSFSADD